MLWEAEVEKALIEFLQEYFHWLSGSCLHTDAMK